MRKLFYVFIFLIITLMFSSILPYPVFSSHTNLTESQVYQVNNHHESEVRPTDALTPSILTLTQNEITPLLCEVFEIIDLKTGQSFNANRIGGFHHADVEPADNISAQTLNKICGESPTWSRRPVLVKLNDYSYIPASLSAYPHGYSQSATNFNGHVCLHFKDSKMDGTKRVDKEHQKTVTLARKAGIKYLQREVF